jgi:hypothetical protein
MGSLPKGKKIADLINGIFIIANQMGLHSIVANGVCVGGIWDCM